eukprot:COSAG01_NODE_603_length_14905_cov_12.534648_6_plen_109_part_00
MKESRKIGKKGEVTLTLGRALGGAEGGAAAVASFSATALTGIYLCDICSCPDVLRRSGRARAVYLPGGTGLFPNKRGLQTLGELAELQALLRERLGASESQYRAVLGL